MLPFNLLNATLYNYVSYINSMEDNSCSLFAFSWKNSYNTTELSFASQIALNFQVFREMSE